MITKLYKYIINNEIAKVEEVLLKDISLLKTYCPKSYKKSYGLTPLHICILEGNFEMYKLLVKSGGDINAISKTELNYDRPVSHDLLRRSLFDLVISNDRTALNLFYEYMEKAYKSNQLDSFGNNLLLRYSLDYNQIKQYPLFSNQVELILIEMFDKLLKKGERLDLVSKNGDSAGNLIQVFQLKVKS